MNKNCYELGSKRSVIRELFEFGKQRKEEIGSEGVFDFSLGNPSIKPNPMVDQSIKELVSSLDTTQIHGYTSAQGDKGTRKAIADHLNQRYGTAYSADELYLTCGAAASLCIAFKAITESKEDEILAIAPYFTEYKVFVENSGATFKVVDADLKRFEINFDDLLRKLNPHTKAIIVNSPNNPSGVVYSEDSLEKLSSILEKKEKDFGHPIYIVADEPYREIVFDGKKVPHIPSIYNNTILCYSYSKSLSLPGERIGYVLVGPKVEDSKSLYLAICGAGRSLGYVCAPSLFQKVIEKCVNYTSDLSEYEENRNLLYDGLTKIGYEAVYPQGAFYLFLKSLDKDAKAFSERAKKYNLLLVPSDDFGVQGYVRLAYCVPKQMIVDSLPFFQQLKKEYQDNESSIK